MMGFAASNKIFESPSSSLDKESTGMSFGLRNMLVLYSQPMGKSHCHQADLLGDTYMTSGPTWWQERTHFYKFLTGLLRITMAHTTLPPK